MNTRAYSLLELKSVDDEQRLLEGIATTPNPDRMNDVVVTDGIEFRLPLPFLYQHDAKNPIGAVTHAKVTKSGIAITAKIAPAGIDSDVDRAWSKIKSGLVRGLSIGFRTLEESFDKSIGGFRILKSEWLELSAVTIPANAEATITSVKSFDIESLAALGQKRNGVIRLDKTHPPGVSGNPKTNAMNINEEITQWDAKLTSTVEQRNQIMEAARKESRLLEDEEQAKYDELEVETGKISKHIDLLKRHEQSVVAKATPITSETVKDEKTGAEARQGRIVSRIATMEPKGIGMARMAIAVANGALTYKSPVEVAQRRWPNNPEVALALKATIEAGDSTTSGWASQLIPGAGNLTDEFLELLRPQTIIGRLPLRRVPFNVSIPIETASGTAQWVGEGAPKPVTKLTLSSVTLRWAKAAAIVGITQELAKFSRPDAEMVVRDSMIATLIRFFDAHFVSTTAEVSNVSPAGILNGITPLVGAPTATTAAAFRTDFSNLLDAMTGNNVSLNDIYILMSSTQALRLSLMVTDLGVQLFPGLTREGGTILNMFPVIISEAVGSKIIAVNTNEIFLASDPGVQVDVSREASVEMSDDPISGDTSPITTSAVLKSAFQNNLIFIKVEQFITWKRGRDTAVEWINGNAYTP